LEAMLVESGAGSDADIARAREESHGLGLFVRSLVGLDREAATTAFDRNLSDTCGAAAGALSDAGHSLRRARQWDPAAAHR
jgi:hypothetical protein